MKIVWDKSQQNVEENANNAHFPPTFGQNQTLSGQFFWKLLACRLIYCTKKEQQKATQNPLSTLLGARRRRDAAVRHSGHHGVASKLVHRPRPIFSTFQKVRRQRFFSPKK